MKDETADALVAASPSAEERAERLNRAAHQTQGPVVTVAGRTWTYSGYYGRWEAGDHSTSPAVRCGACGMPEFTIRYGNYECIAQCARCGNEQTIYDG